MVSTGDTAISLHIRAPWNRGGVGVGVLSRPTEPKVPRSVQIWMGGGGAWVVVEEEEGVGGSDQHSWNTWVGALKEFWTQILPAKFW